MSNWFVFFVITFVVMQTLSFIVEGQSALITTDLTAAVSTTDSTINVTNTSGFLAADFITVGSEDICYSSSTATTFVVSERGCRDTKAQAHPASARVYNETTGIVNAMIGFDILQTLADDGFLAGTVQVFSSLPDLAKAIGKVAIWDYSFLEGPMVWLKYLLFGISAGLIITLVQLVFRRG